MEQPKDDLNWAESLSQHLTAPPPLNVEHQEGPKPFERGELKPAKTCCHDTTSTAAPRVALHTHLQILLSRFLTS